MRLRRGDLWSNNADITIVTGNATLKTNGAVVMGRGAARECRDRFQGIDKLFGEQIAAYKNQPYGLVFAGEHKYSQWLNLGLFQVKYHYKDKADLGLIQHSTDILSKFAWSLDCCLQIAMNFPGIGYGDLRREVVLPIIGTLPDNVEVWEYA